MIYVDLIKQIQVTRWITSVKFKVQTSCPQKSGSTRRPIVMGDQWASCNNLLLLSEVA